MALSWEDVVNKQFQPTKFREGYDQGEVDDFLDEIVGELKRLQGLNEQLTAENEALRAGGAVPAVEAAPDADAAVDAPVADADAAAGVDAGQSPAPAALADAEPGLEVEPTPSSADPASASAAGTSSPLSGPTSTPRPATTATPRRSVPTPGSTTARCTASGRYGAVWASTAAPRRTSWGGTWWVTSSTVTSGARAASTPLQAATNPSTVP